MSDETNTPDQLTLLKERAKMMGIVHSNNIGVEALRAKIEARMAGEPETKSQSDVNPLDDNPKPAVKAMTLREQLLRDELKLVRLRITNMDPKKKDLPGEIITVANEYIGTVKKYIPFGEVTEDGWHVPHCLYTLLKHRKFLNVRTTKTREGRDKVSYGWAPEFSLEVLPPLTPDEMKKLAAAQQAAGLFVNDDQF